MTTNIGTITSVPLREVWPKEDLDFTPWLTANIGQLDRELGIGLREARCEQRAGDFRVDVLAETYDDSIAIENQYGRSDHRHFGQLLTYIAHPDQEVSQGIWIVEEARDEHIKAVERLNEAETVRIWIVEVSVVRIGDSPPAPVFKVVAGPPDSGEIRKAGNNSGALKPDQIEKRDFQAALFAQAEEESIDSPFIGLAPTTGGLRDSPIRPRGPVYRLAVSKTSCRVVVTNRKPQDQPGTWLPAYDLLIAEANEIDREFAAAGPRKKLDWWDDRSENGRWGVTYQGDANQNTRAEAQLRELNEAAAAIKAVFGPRIERLPAELEHAPLEPSHTDED